MQTQPESAFQGPQAQKYLNRYLRAFQGISGAAGLESLYEQYK